MGSGEEPASLELPGPPIILECSCLANRSWEWKFCPLSQKDNAKCYRGMTKRNGKKTHWMSERVGEIWQPLSHKSFKRLRRKTFKDILLCLISCIPVNIHLRDLSKTWVLCLITFVGWTMFIWKLHNVETEPHRIIQVGDTPGLML